MIEWLSIGEPLSCTKPVMLQNMSSKGKIDQNRRTKACFPFKKMSHYLACLCVLHQYLQDITETVLLSAFTHYFSRNDCFEMEWRKAFCCLLNILLSLHRDISPILSAPFGKKIILYFLEIYENILLKTTDFI